MRSIPIDGIDLDVDVGGSGEPVVFIQTALVADEFVPLASQPRLRDEYQTILYHRRGYGNSTPTEGPGSIERDAMDCRDLLVALEIDRAHVVGVSYSAAVALQLAMTGPTLVHTLTVSEPPPVHIPNAEEFISANNELVELYQTQGASFALDNFQTRLVGPNWRDVLDRHVPGAVPQVERDADTFFQTDIPALLSWNFNAEAARRIQQPTLHIGGTESGPWFAEVRKLILDWLPEAEDVVIEDADHNLAATHPEQTSQIVADFLKRHPIRD
jgi:pimeloyl-ACP methyl ester carboxylesterase